MAILAVVAGAGFNVLAHLNLPRIPVGEGALSTGGVTALVPAVLASLLGALLGGGAGMRSHRWGEASRQSR